MAAYAMVEVLVAAVGDKDRCTRRHSDEVGRLAQLLAREMGLPDEWSKILRTAALLHDLGKLDVPSRILGKTGPLTSEERLIMNQHPSNGVLLAGTAPFPEAIKEAIMHHHERYDGTGYPQGLAGDKIPLVARMLAVVDSFTAMTEDRPYRKSLSKGEALAELRANSGSQFDPAIVRCFLKLVAVEPASSPVAV